jgi:hypothetical protein
VVQCALWDWIDRTCSSCVFPVPQKDVPPAKPMASASFGPQRNVLRISAARPPNIPWKIIPFA